jgi:two-component system invasion response regulator UvrY
VISSDYEGPEMPGVGTPVRGEGEPQRDISVLIVDDAPVFRSVASAVVRSTPGFRVVGEAGSGEEAIELVTQHAPALVLLDVRMPGLDGVATARLIAQIQPSAITVLVSADEVPEIAADPVAHGAAAFLQKGTLAPGKLRELRAAHRNVT